MIQFGASTSSWPTCGDKMGGLVLPNPDPVSNQECGDGYSYNPAQSHRYLDYIIMVHYGW